MDPVITKSVRNRTERYARSGYGQCLVGPLASIAEPARSDKVARRHHGWLRSPGIPPCEQPRAGLAPSGRKGSPKSGPHDQQSLPPLLRRSCGLGRR